MTEQEQQRNIRRRLAIIRHAQEVTGNVSQTCRCYGISLPCYYKWLRRYEDFGEEGLRDGSSRPHNSPNETRTEIVGKIIYLRQSNYRCGANRSRRCRHVRLARSGDIAHIW